MQVDLRVPWFAPDGRRYFPKDNPHQFPDWWEKDLPPSAKVVEDDAPAKKPVTPAKK